MHIVVYNIRLLNVDQLSDGYCSLQNQDYYTQIKRRMYIVVYNIRLSNIDQLSDAYCSLQNKIIMYRPTVRCILQFTISDYQIQTNCQKGKKIIKIHFVTLDLFWRINLILKAKNSCVLGDFISLLEFVLTLSSFWYVAFFYIHICTKKNLSLIVKPRF